MANTRQQAIAQLTQLLQDWLPASAHPDIDYSLFLQPLTISPSGVGSFVAVHDDPEGDILGCLVHAEAIVTVIVQTHILSEAISLLTTTFLRLDAQALRQEGIFRLQLKPTMDPHSPTDLIYQVIFDVLYEYLQIPAEAGDIIQEIPLNINLE